MRVDRTAILEWVSKLSFNECTLDDFQREIMDSLPQDRENPLVVAIQRLLTRFDQTGNVNYAELVRAFGAYFAALEEQDLCTIQLIIQSHLRSQSLPSVIRMFQVLRRTGLLCYGTVANALKHVESLADEDLLRYFVHLASKDTGLVEAKSFISNIRGQMPTAEEALEKEIYTQLCPNQTSSICIKSFLECLPNQYACPDLESLFKPHHDTEFLSQSEFHEALTMLWFYWNDSTRFGEFLAALKQSTAPDHLLVSPQEQAAALSKLPISRQRLLAHQKGSDDIFLTKEPEVVKARPYRSNQIIIPTEPEDDTSSRVETN